MGRMTLLTLLVAANLIGGAPLGARNQDSRLRAVRVVDFVTRKAMTLDAKVGPVTVQSVEFTDRGRISEQGGLTGLVRGSGIDSEVSTMIRSHFLAENPSADEWEVTFTLEFLDRSGKLIDRVTRKAKWEGEAKPFDLEHPLLEYVVPAIAQVRIKLEGRLD